MSLPLEEWGFDPRFALSLTASEPIRLGRIVEEQKNAYRIQTLAGLIWARAAGRLAHAAEGRDELPAVGDFVVLTHPPGREDDWGLIERILPRRSQLTRKVAGRSTDAQIIATNVDTVLIASSLNHDFNERRLERYLTMVWSSGAVPVLLLTKLDLCVDPELVLARARAIALGVAVVPVSSTTGAGLDLLLPYLGAGRTVALVGSSGVGKSTLVNRLIGSALQEIQDISTHEDRGRHTTTSRSLIRLPGGAILVDTPGMRELMPWDDTASANPDAEPVGEDVFADVTQLVAGCRFSDCQHETEPACAVRTAIDGGSLDAERYASYLKLRREKAYLERKLDQKVAATERQRWKKIHKNMRRRPKLKT